jgi:hypothetical protein
MIRGTARSLLCCLGVAVGGCSSAAHSLWDEAPNGAGAAMRGSGGSSGASSGGASSSAGAPGANVAGTSAAGGSPGGAKGEAGSAGTAGPVPPVAGTGSGDPAPTRQKLEPADGHTLLFVGQDSSEIDSYAQAFGMPAGVMLYTNVWDGLGVLQPSDFGGYGWSDLGHWTGRSEPFALQVGLDLDHGQNCGSCGGCTRAGTLEQLAQGTPERVALVRAIVDALRDSGRPVLLRVGYEFDAEICPGGFGKYPMQAYRDAFKRVRAIVNEEHADRIALVWNAWAFQARDPGKAVGVAPWGWYPGDDAVDWVGLSVFPGYAAGDPTEQYQADKRRQLSEFAKQHGKPLMIAESTPRARFAPQLGEQAWNGWYQGVFDYVQQSDAKAFCYINMNWEAFSQWSGRGWGDTRVQGSPVAEKWRAALDDQRFVQSSSQLYQELGL